MSGKNRGSPIPVPSDSDTGSSSGSDSDIEELSGDSIPHYMCKVTNRDDPVELSEDEEEIGRPSSSRSGPSSSFPSWAERLKKSRNKKSASHKSKGKAPSGRSVPFCSRAPTPLFLKEEEEDELDSDSDHVSSVDESRVPDNFNKRVDQNIQEYFSDAVAGWDDDADVDKALGELGMKSVKDTFSDLTIELYPHQILGVAWMLSKERTKEYRGGLLCDEMGLGKTIQMIATMVRNKSQDRRVRTTLIVAPLALLSQWKSEIESITTRGKLRVAIHHGNGKLRDPILFRAYHVVLTTYGTLVADFGNEDIIHKLMLERMTKQAALGFPPHDDDEEMPELRPKGPLFKVPWYRVVLDEAHIIRNRLTRAAKAASALDAFLRWSLTGTLIVNSLDDMYTQLHFTGISPCQEWAKYEKTIGRLQKKRPRLAAKKAQMILKGCMMRRTKDSTLNGRKLIELPPKTTTMEELQFSPDERKIYNAVELRMQLQFSKYYREGTIMKHYNCILIMLLRLRQLCAHPWLLRRNPGEASHPDDWVLRSVQVTSASHPAAAYGTDLQRAIKVKGQAWVDQVTSRLKQRRELYQDADDIEDDDSVGDCAICLDPLEDEVVVACKHSFCRGCHSELFKNPPAEQDEMTDDQAEKGSRKCPMCRAVIEKNKFFPAAAFLPHEEEEEDEQPGSSTSSSDANRNGKRRMDVYNKLVDETRFAKRPLHSLGGDNFKGRGKQRTGGGDESDETATLASTKMKHLLTLLEEFLSEKGVKVIIFSQFVTFLHLVSDYLSSEEIAHEIYVGPMDREAREEAVQKFTAPVIDQHSPRVMLISLKCGGVGLNLTAASKVISLDLAWNTATEEQAFDRAHRIGQQRAVDVRRLVIAHTVEQRILLLQERKKVLADGAMGEGKGGKLGRLSVGDLIQLFNVSAEMLRGDDEDGDDHDNDD